MTEKIREGVKEILFEDLIVCSSTHENAPPGKDCGVECKVDIQDQIAASNPVISPMRSGGKKHRKCMDCWEEYIDDLVTRILKKQDSQGVVRKVDGDVCSHCPANSPSACSDCKLKEAGYVAVEPLIKEDG